MTDPQPNDAAATAAKGDHDLPAMVEAILFTTNTPMTAGKIAAAAGVSSQASVRKAVEALNARYAECGAAFEIKAIAGGFQMQTRPEFEAVLSRMHESRKDSRLSQAAVETLAIIAYRQPILRADLEAVRGVASGEVLRGLIDKQMVKIVGRADVLGRPMLYGTTKKFLEVFGLGSLDELPNVEELRQASSLPAAANADGEAADADADQAAPSPEED